MVVGSFMLQRPGFVVGLVAVVLIVGLVAAFRARTSATASQGTIYPIGHNYGSVDSGDQQVLEQLRAHGSDLTKPTDIINYLYIPRLADAKNLAEHLSRGGYAVEVREPLGRLPDGTTESRYSVVLHITEVPSIANIRRMRRLLNDIAQRFNGDYDGWEAQVQK
jgi:hypothetical protein